MDCDLPQPRSWIAIERGTLVFLRHSTDPEARAGLMHTARVLARLDRPDTESLLTIRVGESSTTLVTRFVGGHPLEAASVEDPTRHARIAAAVFSSLADLHHAGVAHGPFTPASLRIGAAGAVTSCGFAAATLASDVDAETWRLRCFEDLWTVAEVLTRLRRHPQHPGRRTPSTRILERRLAGVLQRITTGTITDAGTASAACLRLLPDDHSAGGDVRHGRALRPRRRLVAATATVLIAVSVSTSFDHRFTRQIGAPVTAPRSTPAAGAPRGPHTAGGTLSAGD